MSIGYIIGFIALFAVQCFTTPTFLKAEIPKRCTKSLIWKMVCATLFLATAVLSIFAANNFSLYAIIMIIGFVCSWCGDFLLHVNDKPSFFIYGLAAFLVGHVCYITGYSKAMAMLFPNVGFLELPETIVYILLIDSAIFLLIKRHGVKFGPAFLPCLLYMSTIGIMVVKAYSFAIHILISGETESPIFTAIMFMVGSLFFLISDYTLAILTFKPGIEKHGFLRKVNIWTYFFGQMFLALTILFITI